MTFRLRMTDKRGIGTLICDEVEMTTGNLDFFTPIITENVLKYGTDIELFPVNALTDSGPFEFQIARDPDHYIDLPLTRLSGTITVTKLDGSPLTDVETISICNFFPHTLFKQIEIEVEGTQINDISSSTYPIKAYLETILTYGSEAKSSHLQMAGWSTDTINKEESETAESFKKRKELIKNKNYHFNIILHCDFFHIEKYLLPNLALTVKLIRNSDSYSLMGSALVAKINIKKLRLQIHKIKIDPEFDKGIEGNLIKEPALLPLTQSKIKSFLLQTGTSSTTVQSVLHGTLPQSLVVCFLSAKSFNGDISSNPFFFQHFNLNLLNLRVNGNPFHARPFQPDYTDGDFYREYRNLMDHGGVQHGNNVIAISPKEFVSNSNFYIYDFSPDLCNSYHHHSNKFGHIDIEIGWSTPLTDNIYMIIYGSYKQTIHINGNRNVNLIE